METKKVNEMTTAELEAYLESRKKAERESRQMERKAYESLRGAFIGDMKTRVLAEKKSVDELFKHVEKEATAFKEVMEKYGQLRFDNQQSFTISDGTFKIERKSNKVKKFDERADMAATRLMDFLEKWIKGRDKGTDDPMYQLAMTLLERNKQGDLDYKSISKLYELEEKFGDAEYSEIMQLFKESNVVEGTAVNYYFSQRTDRGVWLRLEISFNRL